MEVRLCNQLRACGTVKEDQLLLFSNAGRLCRADRYRGGLKIPRAENATAGRSREYVTMFTGSWYANTTIGAIKIAGKLALILSRCCGYGDA